MAKRQVFYSFQYIPDNWRVSQVRNIGHVEDNKPVSDNKWEEVKQKGDKEIQKWIDENLKNRSCTVILVGENTAKRKWIDYEIEKSYDITCGTEECSGIPVSNVLKFYFDDESWYAVRPSGTEPKIKIYMYSKGESLDVAEAKLEEMKKVIIEKLESTK